MLLPKIDMKWRIQRRREGLSTTALAHKELAEKCLNENQPQNVRVLP